MKRALALLLLAAAPSPDEKTWEQAEAGFRLAAPAHWTATTTRRDSDRTYRFVLSGGFSVTAWDECAGWAAAALVKDRAKALGAELLTERSVEIDGEIGYGGLYRTKQGLYEEIIVAHDGIGYLLSSTDPAATRRVLASVRWIPIPPKRRDVAPANYQPRKDRVVVLVPEDSDEQFLSAIPLAAKLNRGRPIVLAVGEKMSEPVARFLERYRPTVVRYSKDLWGKPDAVILARSVAEGAVLAPVAARMGVPLVFSADGERILDVEIPPADYVAVASTRGRNAPLAALLAAARGGNVALIDDEVRSDFAELRLEGTTLVGELAGRRVEVPILASKKQESFYGDPAIDLDRDGVCEEDERRLFGSTLEIDGRAWTLTSRLESFIGNLSRGHAGRNLLGLTTPAEPIARRLQKLQPKVLALVGTSDEIPFQYVRSEYYFLVQGWTSPELATDAIYGNIDRDGYQEIAVGRLPLSRRDEGSAVIATAIAYDEIADGGALSINPGFPKLKSDLPTVMPDAEAAMRAVEREFAAAGVKSQGLYRETATLERAHGAIGGSRFLFYENHAGPETWSFGESTLVPRWMGRVFPEPPKGTLEIPKLDGEPFVFCGGCLSGGIDLGYDACFPIEFLRRGAVGYVGNTRFGLGGTTGHALRRIVHAMLYDGATIGEAFRQGKNRLWFVGENGPSEYAAREAILECYHTLTLFGDPGVKAGLATDTPFETLYRSIDEKRARLSVAWRGDAWAYTVLGPDEKEIPVRTGRGLEYSRGEILPAGWLSIPAPDGARSAKLKVASGPAWMLRSWEVVDGELLLEVAFLRKFDSAREIELEVEYSDWPAGAPRRRVFEQAAFRLELPDDTWKLQPAEQGLYVVDVTRPLNSLHLTWWDNPQYTAETFLEKRPEDFRRYYPEAKVAATGRHEGIPWVEYDVEYPGMGRYRTRELFLSRGKTGLIVALYMTPDGTSWSARALGLLSGLQWK